AGRGRDKVPDSNADRHGEKDPEGKEPIEKGELLSRGWCADTALRYGSRRHQQTSQCASLIVVGKGAPSRSAYFAGEQQALVSRSLSACIALSSWSKS